MKNITMEKGRKSSGPTKSVDWAWSTWEAIMGKMTGRMCVDEMVEGLKCNGGSLDLILLAVGAMGSCGQGLWIQSVRSSEWTVFDERNRPGILRKMEVLKPLCGGFWFSRCWARPGNHYLENKLTNKTPHDCHARECVANTGVRKAWRQGGKLGVAAVVQGEAVHRLGAAHTDPTAAEKRSSS